MRVTITIIIAGLVLGCGKGHQPQVTLPRAPHTPSTVDYSPLIQTVTLDAQGGMWFDSRTVGNAELKSALESKIKKHGLLPVAIYADAQLPFKELWATVQIPVSVGVRRPSVAVLKDPECGVRYIDFQVTAPRPDLDSLIIESKGGILTLNGNSVQYEKLDKMLTRVASFSRDVCVAIIPDMEQSVQDVIDLLDLCEREGLINKHILETSPVLPDLKDAQQKPGTYFKRPNTTF